MLGKEHENITQPAAEENTEWIEGEETPTSNLDDLYPSMPRPNVDSISDDEAGERE